MNFTFCLKFFISLVFMTKNYSNEKSFISFHSTKKKKNKIQTNNYSKTTKYIQNGSFFGVIVTNHKRNGNKMNSSNGLLVAWESHAVIPT